MVSFRYEAVLETKTHLTRSLAQENGLRTMSQLLASTGDRPNRLSGEMENREDDDGSAGCDDDGDGNGNGRKRSAAAATSENGGKIIDLLDSSSDEENSAANHNDGNNEIIELLDSRGELNVSAVQEELGLEQATASQHLNLMRDKGILRSRRDGVNVYYGVRDDKVVQIINCLRACDVDPKGPTAS